MKRIFWILTLFLLPISALNADEIPIPLKTDTPPVESSERRRSQQIPLSAFFDDDIRTITVYGDIESTSVTVFIYINGQLLEQTSSLNVPIQIPEDISGVISILISGEGWEVSGNFELY